LKEVLGAHVGKGVSSKDYHIKNLIFMAGTYTQTGYGDIEVYKQL
jgi:hypothetical protein